MNYCSNCYKIETMCGCKNPYIVNQTVNSATAGRDGLSAKEIAKNSGKFLGTTDDEFVEFNKGPKGDKGEDGGQIYTNADW